MKSCLNCLYYSMDSGKEVGKADLNFCLWHQKPAYAAYFNRRVCTSLEELAENCPFYKEE